MPDEAGEKTEEATPRKRQKARDEGQVAFSAEVNSAGLLIIGFAGLAVMGPMMWQRSGAMMRFCLSDALTLEFDNPRTLGVLWTIQEPLMALLGMFLLLAFLIGGVLGASQVGLALAPKALQPKATRISAIRTETDLWFARLDAVYFFRVKAHGYCDHRLAHGAVWHCQPDSLHV